MPRISDNSATIAENAITRSNNDSSEKAIYSTHNWCA